MSSTSVFVLRALSLARAGAAFLVLFGLEAAVVQADCECGYSCYVNSTSHVFTDLIESDFSRLINISLDTDWQRQSFNVSAKSARGPYGTSYQLGNVLSNPMSNDGSSSQRDQLGGGAGLQLFVRGGIPSNGFVPDAEVNSVRTDLLWGSFRASIRLTNIPGTCSAFFWYFNDSQEIDMEFLSSDFDAEKKSFPVNLVLQSAQSAQQGYSTTGANNYVVANLPFDPTSGFHEYRIDYVPGSVVYYADGNPLAAMQTSMIPMQPGHLILTQWSNGNPLWSSGPPTQDAVMTVSYVKSYFNSSLRSRQHDFAARCINPNGKNAICVVPEQFIAPGPNGNSSGYFFSDVYNMTNNQTVYREGGVSRSSPSLLVAFLALIAIVSVLLG